MKKYVCPMGCVEPQDQPGNCPECGMKLLEMQTKQTSHRLGRQYANQTDSTQINADSADFTQTMQTAASPNLNNISAKSALTSAKSALTSAKSAYLYFI
jgi:hypothetical protein